jgi:hypothetical protein
VGVPGLKGLLNEKGEERDEGDGVAAGGRSALGDGDGVRGLDTASDRKY